MIKYAVIISLALMSAPAMASGGGKLGGSKLMGAKGCVIKNSTGVMNVSNPKHIAGTKEMEFEDSVKGTQRMLFWPMKTLFCQNGKKTKAGKVSGTCQLKPAANKSGGNNIWKLLCQK